MSDSCKKKTTIGGQALIEGIMMLGPEKAAIAVRKADGEIECKVDPASSLKARHKIFALPLIRGVIGLFESMKRGISALNYSASFAAEAGKRARGSPANSTLGWKRNLAGKRWRRR